MGYDGVFSIILEANEEDSQFSCTGSVVQFVGPHSTNVSSVVMYWVLEKKTRKAEKQQNKLLYTRIVPGALGGTGPVSDGASPVQYDISCSAYQ